MRKPENTTKFPERLPQNTTSVTVHETAEDAIRDAVAQAASANVSPSSVMVSFAGGYVTGDGQVHTASGITASPRLPVSPEPAESSIEESPASDGETASEEGSAGETVTEKVIETPKAEPEVTVKASPKKD